MNETLSEVKPDTPIENKEEDVFGFEGIAERLAPSLINAANGEGIVIGLEGAWGSGKTSLVNLAMDHVRAVNDDKLHVLSIAPWLVGDAITPVGSLIGPMATILEEKSQDNSAQSKAKKLAKSLRDYGIATGRTFAPLAGAIEKLTTGQAVGTKVADAGLEALEKLIGERTVQEKKDKIVDAIRETEHRFIVVLDDLDRLEPSQLVEVVRLVKSVADFPNVAYLLCYDQNVVAHALEVALNVESGATFLQKIVQISFKMPRFEEFALRLSARAQMMEVYRQVHGCEPSDGLQGDLYSAVDSEGGAFSTPREVKTVLNAVRFTYPAICNDTYFPDVCRLAMIKTLRPELYYWIENYMSLQAVISAGVGTLSKLEIRSIGESFQKFFPEDAFELMGSSSHIAKMLPGVGVGIEAEKCVFQYLNPSDLAAFIDNSRLGSPLHYRFYFALAPSSHWFPDTDFERLVGLSRSDPSALESKLLEWHARRFEDRQKWFYQIMRRWLFSLSGESDWQQLKGLTAALANIMDVTADQDLNRGPLFGRSEITPERLFFECLKIMQENFEEPEVKQHLKKIFQSGKGKGTLFGHVLRSELFAHNLIGDGSSSRTPNTSKNVAVYLLKLAKNKFSGKSFQNDMSERPHFSGQLFLWKEILGDAPCAAWIKSFTRRNANFLTLLDNLRNWAQSSFVYYPLQKSSVECFLDYEATIARLEKLAKNSDPQIAEKAQEIQLAIRQASEW